MHVISRFPDRTLRCYALLGPCICVALHGTGVSETTYHCSANREGLMGGLAVCTDEPATREARNSKPQSSDQYFAVLERCTRQPMRLLDKLAIVFLAPISTSELLAAQQCPHGSQSK
eukprot:5228065-Amphidinium_carterae.1